MRSSLLALVLSFLAFGSAAEAAQCQLLKYADVPVTMVGRRPTVSAKIDGHDTRLLIDTGGFFSTLNSTEAARFGMKLTLAPERLKVRGFGGEVTDLKMVTAKTFEVGPFNLRQADFITTATGGFGQEVSGLLGENLLGEYDVEYDFGEGAIRIFGRKGDCDKSAPTYWSKDYSMVSTESVEGINNKLIATVTVNGRKLRAMFDTGAPTSVLSLKSAAKVGLTPQSPGVRAAGVMRGMGFGEVNSWIVPIDSFAIDNESIKGTRMQMAAIQADADMILGADFFLAHRMFVSARRREIYFTYSGGEVFNLETRTGVVGEPAPLPPSGSDAAPPAAADAAPRDADGFARRGAAFLARGDMSRAIADFNRAVELEPKVEQHYLDRARARLRNREPVLAMADLDQAVVLKPDDAQALMTRGGLYLNLRDEARAQKDFEAAMALPAADPNLEMAVGAAYDRTGRYAKAVDHYDRWIAAHPKDMRMDAALNQRCWARAEWNRDLTLALADCDQALKLRPRTARYLDSRGLVKLRMGDVDQALSDYDAALAIQPKEAWSLYARGLAKQKKGDKAGGDADIAAGLALDKNLNQQAQRMGLVAAPVGAPAAAN